MIVFGIFFNSIVVGAERKGQPCFVHSNVGLKNFYYIHFTFHTLSCF